jgi:hypothetical protein
MLSLQKSNGNEKRIFMSELDLVLVNETTNCTIYSIQFVSEDESEFEKFYKMFKDDAEYNPDLV